MSVLHETKIEHAHDAALDLSNGSLLESVRAEVVNILSRAYNLAEDLPEDVSAEPHIIETLELLAQARVLLEGSVNNDETSREIRILIRKLKEAETAVREFGQEVQNYSV